MKIMDKVWGSLGLFEEQTEVEEEFETKSKKSSNVVSAASNVNNVVNLHTASQTKQQLKVMVMEPVDFDSAQNVADYLKNRKPVVVNFENTEKEIAKRMIDFISGTTYALNGTIQKIGSDIFLCAPSNVDVSYTPREDEFDKAVFPWASSGFGK